MSVTIFRTGNAYYWRVYRRWGEHVSQEYIPFGDDPHASMERAVDLDLSLRERQRAYQLSLVYSLDYWVRPDGKVRGIYVGFDGRGRPGFRADISLPWKDGRLRASRSILHRTPLDAYRSILVLLAKEVGFDSWSDLAKSLRQCYPAYASDLELALEKTA